MISLTSEQIVNKVREFKGTPFHHTGRIKGVGIDCIGLVVCTFQELGVDVDDVVNYSESGDYFEVLAGSVAKYAKNSNRKNMHAGDIVLFRSDDMYNHVAIATSPTRFIHAYNSGTFKKVVELELTDYWATRVRSLWEYRGLTK